jgi:DNA-3-methyladenine glycosylase
VKPLARAFYARDALEVAPLLLGRTLVSESEAGTVTGRIVEVEAYCGPLDPASHAYRGPTRRNAVMFGPPGHLYVYFTYGMHYCANVVCESVGSPGAVLLRAVEPLSGLDLMGERRGVDSASLRLLARGPARLAQAFGIDRSLDGSDLVGGPVWIGGRQVLRGDVVAGPRIGITKAAAEPWRFYEVGPWASPRRLPVPGRPAARIVDEVNQ